jgi:hypothetical protein
LEGHRDDITDLSLTRGGELLSCSADEIVYWDLETASINRRVEVPDEYVLDCTNVLERGKRNAERG